MREIRFIVIHCTATRQDATVTSIRRYWKSLGWKNPGYHYLIEASGTVHILQPHSGIANGVAGYNAHALHVSYIGGVDVSGKPVDNRTEAQRKKMLELVKRLRAEYPRAKVLGHRDFPDVRKACPSFDVAAWLKECAVG